MENERSEEKCLFRALPALDDAKQEYVVSDRPELNCGNSKRRRVIGPSAVSILTRADGAGPLALSTGLVE